MSVKARQRVERSIARRFILDAKRAGYFLTVFDGEEVTLTHSRDVKAILAAMFTVDDEYLYLERDDGQRIGWVRFIYGNDGWDVINDYSANDIVEGLMVGADALSDV